MKPKGWDKFLKAIADDFNVRGKLKEIFLVRFAYENWRKPDREIWELAEAASHETYKKQMTKIYSFFANTRPEGCPELDTNHQGPGKFQILREWLKDIKHPEWLQEAVPAFPVGMAALAPDVANQSQAPLYIERVPMEAQCFQTILKPGALIRIQAPEKMGKTSLLNRTLAFAEARDCRKVYLNLQAAESRVFANLDKFLRWFSANVSRELGLKPNFDDYWDEDLFGSLVSCKTYFQEALLKELGEPLVLGLDNLDRVFAYPDIAQDFLPMLRLWHEEANNLEIWQQLRLAIANSTEANIQLDVNQSPFNVGFRVRLSGFDQGQVQQLIAAYGLDWDESTQTANAQALMALLNGHPYLLRLALDALKQSDLALEQLLQEAPTQGGIYRTHLRHHWEQLNQQPELAAAMKAVVVDADSANLDPDRAFQLESMGLVTLMGDRIQPSCELYHRYFAEQL